MLQGALVVLLFAAQTSPPIRPAPFPAPPPAHPPTPLAPADAPEQVERPRLISLPSPSEFYPPAALAEAREGVTQLRCILTPEGLLTECSVHQSSGSADLDAAAFQIAARARYTPMRVSGDAVRASVVLPVRWVIGG
ncbi:energy transducer TonB [Sphingomonas koreensis]